MTRMVEAFPGQEAKVLSEKKLNLISVTEVLITDVVAPANWRLLEQMDQNGRRPES
jgi:hypothetical protein